MCGVHGMDSNEFKDRSRFAAFPYIIFSKGTDDEPAGDCVTCDTVWDIGGYASEFGTKENFKAERDRDIGLTQAWKKSCALWLEAHNAGRRCRARSDKTKKRRGGSNFIDQVQDIRKIRKRIVKEKSRNFKVKVPLKIYTPERYKVVHKRSIEKAGLTASWHGTPDGPVWGVLARAIPAGECDAVDEQCDGVREEEELDSGNEEVRENQQQMKFDSVAKKIGDLTKSAADCFIASALAVNGDGGGPSESGASDSDNDENSDDDEADLSSSSEAPGRGFAFSVPAKKESGSSAAAVAKNGRRVGGGVVAKAVPRQKAKAEVVTKPAHTTPTKETPADTDTELENLNFSTLTDKWNLTMKALTECPALSETPLQVAQQNAAITAATEQWEAFHKFHGDVAKTEQTCRRKKNFNEHALDRVLELKGMVNSLLKVLGAMKGVRSEWTQVMQAWRQLAKNFPDDIGKLPGIICFLLKREAQELSRYGKLEGLADLLYLQHEGGMGAKSVMTEDMSVCLCESIGIGLFALPGVG